MYSIGKSAIMATAGRLDHDFKNGNGNGCLFSGRTQQYIFACLNVDMWVFRACLMCILR